MAKGSGSATKTLFFAVALVSLYLTTSPHGAEATEFIVGDDKRWSFNVSGWPNGKCFKAGDFLVFKYNKDYHNVVELNEAAYSSCTVTPGSKVYGSGDDRLTLTKGKNYFICGFPGHCEKGMKIEVDAA